MKKKKKNLYGERIHFNASGKLTYINNMACPVGETITKLYSINLKGKKLIVDFESKKWPWKKNKTIREKRTFKIITWSSDMIVLKQFALKKILVTLLITFLILAFVVLAMGGGHGTFLPAKLCYPYSMIIALKNNQIDALASFLAIIQVPVYAFMYYVKPKWFFLIIIVHIVFTCICLNMKTETFF